MSDAVLGADVGGTFTDVVAWDGATLTTGKTSSTTDDQSRGVTEGAALVGGAGATRLVHGTTVATNALLERAGSPTALVTTAGFGDVIEIGRQDRPSLYDSFADRPEPLVPSHLRCEIPRGDEPWDADALAAAVGEVEAVAVSLLYGYEQADREEAIAAALRARRPDLAVSCSSRVAPEFREFERTSTTVLNAYLTPRVARYLAGLADRAAAGDLPRDLTVMRSSGGLASVAEAAELPAAILLSGPAGGVVAAAALGAAVGRRHVVSFDMGGTSTDVCRIDGGRPDVAYERAVGGYPCRMPAVAVHTVGAGGGSVAWPDAGGSLRVGPRSAGADPGPACYGRGGLEPAVTDADVMLGRINPQARLAGTLPVRRDLAEAALAGLGAVLGLDPVETAAGIVTVVEETMAGAIRKVSVEQGADPRDAVLVAFVGAGGLHASALARRLGMAGVLVPAHAGVFSALGLLLSPPRVDVAQGTRLTVGSDLDAAVGAIETEAKRRLTGTGAAVRSVSTGADVRYRGQAHELTISYRPGEGWPALAARFHDEHCLRNGFARPDDPLEVVAVRAAAAGDPALAWRDLPDVGPGGDANRGTRAVHTGDGPVDAAVFDRDRLGAGDEIVGPAVVEEDEATTYLGPGERAVVHPNGALEITW